MAKLPGRRSKTALMTEAQKDVESKFGRCPKGHALPHRTNKGNCTPLFCAGSTPGSAAKLAKAAKSELVKDLGAEDVDTVEADTMTRRIATAVTRHKARASYVKLPEKFPDAKAREKWVEDKKQELVPVALADLEFSLKLGDSQEREKARREVLEMTGHGKREGGGGSTSPLIILTGVSGNLGDNPWVRRVDKDGKELPANVQVIDASQK